MDCYTTDTQKWLDQRFQITDEEGIYFAHQPIYGFRRGHCEPGLIVRYIITYQIMRALSHLEFSSLLDVGGAEGYKSALARSIFNVYVNSVDLSAEACARAKEIYNVDGEPVDINHLPYKDNEFDVVLCSETLEHVPDLQKATNELLRVCSKAVVITVPIEPKEVVEKNIRERVPHAHIHSLDKNSFDFVLSKGFKVISRSHHNPYLRIITHIADAIKIEKHNKSCPQFVVSVYNSILPLLRLFFGKNTAAMLIRLDDYISNFIPSYSGLTFIILKDDSCYSRIKKKKIGARKVIDFKVPYYYLQ